MKHQCSCRLQLLAVFSMVSVLGGCSLNDFGLVSREDTSDQTMVTETSGDKLQVYIGELSQKALQGNIEAQFTLGNMYLMGQISAEQRYELMNKFNASHDEQFKVEKDFNKAAYWFRLAAEQGHAESQARLALICYRRQTDQKEPYKEGLLWALKSFKQNNDLAAVLLGSAFLEGWGVSVNFKKAYYYFDKANLDHVDHSIEDFDYFLENYYVMGGVLTFGQIKHRDMVKAARMITKAADQGYIEAKQALIAVYSEGRGVKRDLKKSLQYGLEVEATGDTSMGFTMASLLCAYEELIPEVSSSDLKMIYSDLNKLYVKGDANAALVMANLLIHRNDEMTPEQRLQEALKLTAFAADSIPEAQIILDGIASKLAEKEALANAGSIEDMLFISYFYSYTSPEARPDFVKSVYYADRAAAMGSPQGQMLLAYYYAEGRGVQKSKDKSIQYIRMAADQGVPEAIVMLRKYEDSQSFDINNDLLKAVSSIFSLIMTFLTGV